MSLLNHLSAVNLLGFSVKKKLLYIINHNEPLISLRVFFVFQLQRPAERVEAVRTRVSRMVVVMVLLFIVCWGPIQILILLQAFCSEDVSHSYTLYKLKIWAHCMSYSNSSINPVIYAFMGANFRKAFRSVFPLIFKRNARTTEPLPTYNREMNFLSSWPQRIFFGQVVHNCILKDKIISLHGDVLWPVLWDWKVKGKEPKWCD